MTSHEATSPMWNFRSDIDLVDETLREGSERASVPASLEAKCELGQSIARAGIKSLVVGMFPDVPHNIELLKALLERQKGGDFPSDVRFIVISHVGETMQQTMRVLNQLDTSLQSVWILAIHGVSDLQITHLFPTILRKDPTVSWDQAEWDALDMFRRRERSGQWLKEFLPVMRSYTGGGVMVGLIDTFRSEFYHLKEISGIVSDSGIRQIRLLDTAGSCLPHQVPMVVGHLADAFPNIDFYGHFHDDFGMATANAMLGLSCGLRGVEVSVGGFANRAGHPPLAEVAVGLRTLYGIEIPNFHYHALFALSRLAEKTYGLMENSAQAITGIMTHSVQSGIRTELIKKAPQIFDILDPRSVGAELTRMFGVRSGQDGVLRFLTEHAPIFESLGLAPTSKTAELIFNDLDAEWSRRSRLIKTRLLSAIADYQRGLGDAFFTEDEMTNWIQSSFVDRRVV
jgi:isopropylmalate/homocitrate/citramalate synthase